MPGPCGPSGETGPCGTQGRQGDCGSRGECGKPGPCGKNGIDGKDGLIPDKQLIYYSANNYNNINLIYPGSESINQTFLYASHTNQSLLSNGIKNQNSLTIGPIVGITENCLLLKNITINHLVFPSRLIEILTCLNGTLQYIIHKGSIIEPSTYNTSIVSCIEIDKLQFAKNPYCISYELSDTEIFNKTDFIYIETLISIPVLSNTTVGCDLLNELQKQGRHEKTQLVFNDISSTDLHKFTSLYDVNGLVVISFNKCLDNSGNIGINCDDGELYDSAGSVYDPPKYGRVIIIRDDSDYPNGISAEKLCDLVHGALNRDNYFTIERTDTNRLYIIDKYPGKRCDTTSINLTNGLFTTHCTTEGETNIMPQSSSLSITLTSSSNNSISYNQSVYTKLAAELSEAAQDILTIKEEEVSETLSFYLNSVSSRLDIAVLKMIKLDNSICQALTIAKASALIQGISNDIVNNLSNWQFGSLTRFTLGIANNVFKTAAIKIGSIDSNTINENIVSIFAKQTDNIFKSVNDIYDLKSCIGDDSCNQHLLIASSNKLIMCKDILLNITESNGKWHRSIAIAEISSMIRAAANDIIGITITVDIGDDVLKIINACDNISEISITIAISESLGAPGSSVNIFNQSANKLEAAAQCLQAITNAMADSTIAGLISQTVNKICDVNLDLTQLFN